MFAALQQLFPELGWTQFSPDETARLLRNLDGFGTHGPPAAAHLRAHAARFGYFPQARSGAGWTLLGNLILPPGTDLDHPRIAAVIIHEVLHLQQPLTQRLSVQGELLGWQLEYRAYHEVTGRYYGEKGVIFEGSAPQWAELSRLLPESYADLTRAQLLMKQVSPRYRADWLPLYPLGHQLLYRLTRPL